MGKGDKKTKKGKRFRGSSGVTRLQKKKINIAANSTPTESVKKEEKKEKVKSPEKVDA